MSAHQVIIVTKEAERLAVIDVIFANNVSWARECKSIAIQWLRDNNKKFLSDFAANGNLTVWAE
jgi:hypothetical protein